MAAIGLLGYLPGLELLASFGEDFLPMAPASAFCLIVLGGLLLGWPLFSRTRRALWTCTGYDHSHRSRSGPTL